MTDTATEASANAKTPAAHLESLVNAMEARGYTGQMVQPRTGPAYARFINKQAPRLAENILCAAASGELWFWWSWAERIGSVREIDAVADRIVHVFTPHGRD